MIRAIKNIDICSSALIYCLKKRIEKFGFQIVVACIRIHWKSFATDFLKYGYTVFSLRLANSLSNDLLERKLRGYRTRTFDFWVVGSNLFAEQMLSYTLKASSLEFSLHLFRNLQSRLLKVLSYLIPDP